MGIRGLTSYIKDQGDDLWTEVDLKNTKVIIDGNGLFYRLYFNSGLDCRRGGQYRQFHDLVCSVFNLLKTNNVQPFVVLDGASDPSDRKLGTSIKRAQESIPLAYRLANSDPLYQETNVRPSLLRRTFIQALGDLKVEFAVCDFEADEEIASLANKWGCPVIGEDSDYFIFDLKAGYFPLTGINFDNNPARARLFKIEKLSAHLGISKELLPLLASILGNDFVSEDVRLLLYEHLEIDRPIYARKIISKISSLLKAEPDLSLEDALRAILIRVPDQNRREELRQALEISIESYKDCDTELATYFETGGVSSNLRSNAIHDPRVLKKIRQGLFPVSCMEMLAVGRLFLKPQVEDFEVPAADQCSLELRSYLYGFLDGKADVDEYSRIGMALKKRSVHPCRHLEGYGELPNLSAISDLEIAERRKLCLSLLESNVGCVENLPEELQLFAASLRYWQTHADPPPKESHLRALTACHVMLKGEAELQGIQASSSFDLAAQHSFAQWQCVMKEAVSLNLILQEPIPTPPIRRLYDGLLVQYLVLDIEGGSNTQVSWQSKEDFQTLYSTVSTVNKEQKRTEQRKATAHHRCCTVL